MARNAKHCFGSEKDVQAAIDAGSIDNFDILFLNEKKVGWIDKNGKPVIIDNPEYVVNVEGDALPATGVAGTVYVFKNVLYIWDGTAFVDVSNGADIAKIEEELAKKVDETTVDTKIEEAVSAISIDIVEF